MSETEIREIENILLKIDSVISGTKDATYQCTVQLDIADVGSWLIKFRKSGVIVNNRAIVISNLAQVDATLSFGTYNAFFYALQNDFTFDSRITSENMRQTGSDEAIMHFKRAVLHCVNPSEPSNITIQKPSRLPAADLNGQQCIKEGWLYKRRDLFKGWNLRYFVVHMGRIDYYSDQNGKKIRGQWVISEAEILPLKKSNVNGMEDHWGFTIVTKHNHLKNLKIASYLTGQEGRIEASSWERAIAIASAENYSKMNAHNYRRMSLKSQDYSNVSSPEQSNRKSLSATAAGVAATLSGPESIADTAGAPGTASTRGQSTGQVSSKTSTKASGDPMTSSKASSGSLSGAFMSLSIALRILFVVLSVLPLILWQLTRAVELRVAVGVECVLLTIGIVVLKQVASKNSVRSSRGS